MKIQQIIIAAVACVAASASFAGNVTEFTDLQFTSSKARSEVIAELKQARAQGQIARGEEATYPVYSPSASTKTVADVRKELIQSASRPRNLDYDVSM